jgi:hypothetical protein
VSIFSVNDLLVFISMASLMMQGWYLRMTAMTSVLLNSILCLVAMEIWLLLIIGVQSGVPNVLHKSLWRHDGQSIHCIPPNRSIRSCTCWLLCWELLVFYRPKMGHHTD